MIVITGPTGQLGTAFGRLLKDREVRNLSEDELDFQNLDAIPNGTGCDRSVDRGQLRGIHRGGCRRRR